MSAVILNRNIRPDTFSDPYSRPSADAYAAPHVFAFEGTRTPKLPRVAHVFAVRSNRSRKTGSALSGALELDVML